MFNPHLSHTYFLLAFILGASACNNDRSVRYPSQELIGLGFVVYHENEQVGATGSIQSAESFTFGSFEIPEGLTASSVDLIIFDEDKAHAQAEAACETFSSAEARFVCQKTLSSCDPIENCWSIELSETACSGRIELSPSELGLTVFREEKGFLIEDTEGLSKTVNELFFCGPKSQVDCPYKVPGFVVTENAFFHCLAPSEQMSCNLSIDLATCGIERAVGQIQSNGELQIEFTDPSACQIVPATAQDTSELGIADFVVSCGERRYAVTYADSLIGQTDCPHLGPSYFDGDLDRAGRLSSVVPLTTANGQEQLILTGSGNNNCEYGGSLCRTRAGGCVDCCRDLCGQSFLTRCVERDDLSTCAESPKSSCINDCLRCCNNLEEKCSSRYRQGLSMIAMSPTRQYTTNSRLKMEPTGTVWAPIQGDKTVAVIDSNPSNIQMVFIHKAGLNFTALNENDVLSKDETSVAFDFEASSVHHWKNQIIVTGHSESSPTAESTVLSILYDDRANPAAGYTKSLTTLPELNRIDYTATGKDSLFLAAQTPGSNNDRSNTIFALNSDFEIVDRYVVEGEIHGIAVLKEKVLVVAVHDSADEQDILAIFTLGMPEQQSLVRVLKGLKVSSLKTQDSKNRIFIGYELAYVADSSHTGAIAVLEQDKNQNYVLQAPFMMTKGGRVDTIELSTDETRLYAVSSQGNWISSFQLYE